MGEACTDFEANSHTGNSRKLFSVPGDWAVIRTRYRCEKNIHKALSDMHVPAFLPLMGRRTLNRGRVAAAKVPLFSGYLFYNADSVNRVTILSLSQVVQIIKPEDSPRLRRELRNLADALDRNAVQWRELFFKEPGMPVTVVGGPLKGLAGEFLRFAKKGRLVIKISLLGRGIETELDEAYVRPVLN